jgi:hypothetical protein
MRSRPVATPFYKIVYDPVRCRRELKAFAKLLKSNPELSERGDILPFFRKREQLAAFIGTFAPDIGPAAQIAFEFSFLGDYAADLVVGNQAKGAFLAVEFEDGRTTSIFKKVKGKSTTDWSPRFDHGFSQLVDWFCTVDDYKKTNKFQRDFGDRHVTFSGLLIIGRNSGVSANDRRRLDWRSDKVLVDSHSISCMTFDDLAKYLGDRLAFYPQASKFEKDQ